MQWCWKMRASVYACSKYNCAYITTGSVPKRPRRVQSRVLGVVDGTGFSNFFPENLDVTPWTIFRQEFQPLSIADGPFSTFMAGYLLGLKKGSRTRLAHGTGVMHEGRLVLTSVLHARGERKPPFSQKDLDGGYYVVDADVKEVFRNPPQLSFAIGIATVILNKQRSVTAPHVDLDNAFFFMVKGSKTFRCSTSIAKKVTRPEGFTSPHRASAPHFDIVLQEGDVLFVPHHRHHCVHSEPNSIGISVTVIKPTQRDLSINAQKSRGRERDFVTNAHLKQSAIEIAAVVRNMSKEVKSPLPSVQSECEDLNEPSMDSPTISVTNAPNEKPSIPLNDLEPSSSSVEKPDPTASSQSIVNASTPTSRGTIMMTNTSPPDNRPERSLTQVCKVNISIISLH